MDSPTQIEAFVDADTIAAHLKVTRRQVLEMTRRGAIPGYPLGTGLNRRIWRYKLSEIDALVTASIRSAPERASGHSAASTTLAAAVPGGSRKGRI